jgi:DNA-3-methyladenine glycosylase II
MREVIAHFEKVDPLLAPVIAAAFAGDKPIALRAAANPDKYFEEIAEAIVSQQLSVKAADTIWGRFVKLAGKVTPEKVAKLSLEDMREVGLSYQKAGYLQSIAASFLAKEIDFSNLHKLDNDAIIAELTNLKGIGPWTAEMFLMFTLGRPDVFSYLDLGLVRGFERVYGVSNPSREQMEAVVAKWSPYRTYAALALWHHKDNQPLG